VIQLNGTVGGRHARRYAGVCMIVMGLAIAGCPAGGGSGDPLPSDFEDGNVDETVTSPLGKTAGEPNGDFTIPVVGVEDDGLFRLKGTVATTNDLDVFLLGSFSAGDRIFAEALAVNSLDVSIAIFDGEGRLATDNDDLSNSNLDAEVDFIVRHDSDSYYLVVTRSAFAESRRRTGTYTANVEVSRGGSVPGPVQQVVYLKFDGGRLDSPNLGEFDLDPFDAGAISRAYDGDTQEMKDTILAVMRQNYEPFNVIVESSDDFEPNGTQAVSTIWFGGFNEQAFGIAENVDLYNAELCDDAIIFTESFSPFLFSSTPSAEEMGIAIGNVATHEAGHLLGLNHVDDDLDIMDDRSAADAFLLDQEFMESPLSTDIMPIGTQDGVLLLDEIVGPSDGSSAKLMVTRRPAMTMEWGVPGGVEVVRHTSRAATK